jgi:hypothetical protein
MFVYFTLNFVFFSAPSILILLFLEIFLLTVLILICKTNILLCKLFFYMSFVISTLLPTVLVLASIDRLLISSQNFDTRLYSSKCLAYFSISISTIFWIMLNIHI